LKLIPRDSSDSPFHPGKLSQQTRFQRIVNFSKTRANHNHLSSSPSSSPSIHLQVLKQGFFYTVRVYIGTPRRPHTLLMDTGSGLIWTQCKPCVNCFSQNIPIFAPNDSHSYRKLPCNHSLCRQLHQCVNGECVYSQRYAGGSVTKGVVSLETFSFPLNNGGFKPIKDVVFGCSNDNQNFTFDSISGILGLSYSPDSLATQLGKSIEKRFSYCFPHSYSPMTLNSVLRFGNDIEKSQLLRTTPFVRETTLSGATTTAHHYYLNLLDISVGRRRLGFPQGTFSLKQNGTGGCIIDSGCVLSFLDEKPYWAVMRDFEAQFRRIGLERVRNLTVGFELCYRHVAKNVNANVDFDGYDVSLTFHFEGADFEVEPKYVYFYNKKEKYFCVALMSFPGKTIIGAWQQQNTRFVYDLNSHLLHFSPEDCSNDRM
ncbi:Aspartic peptidase, partial [Parasponia andersonii]